MGQDDGKKALMGEHEWKMVARDSVVIKASRSSIWAGKDNGKVLIDLQGKLTWLLVDG